MEPQEEEEEATEEPVWLQDLLSGGPVELINLEEDIAGWASPLGDSFQVRSKDYLMNKVKIPGGDWLLKPIALDWMRGRSRIDGVLLDRNNRVMARINEAKKKGDLLNPFVWAVNIQVPSKDHHSLVAYYISTAPFPEDSLVDRFINGDDDFRNSRLKLIANVAQGPWIVKTAVGDHAICLLGKSLTCRYSRGENFLEVDVDIGSSMVASAIVHLAINYITSLTIDLAFLIEGRTEEELPERILGSVRFAKLEPNAAIPFEQPVLDSVLTDVPAKDVDDEEEEEFEDLISERKEVSFQSRLWRSFGEGLAVDWWGRQQT